MTSRKTLETLVRFSAPVMWALIMLWLSLSPSPPQLPGVLGWDKLLHAGAYGLLTILIAQLLLYLSIPLGKAGWPALLPAVCYGALLEVLQLLLHTGRTAEWWDLFADAVGAVLAYLVFRRFSGMVCLRRELRTKGRA
jgi:VanZ family protein